MARFALVLVIFLSAGLISQAAPAALNSAKVTQIKNDVRLSEVSVSSSSSEFDPAPPRNNPQAAGKARAAKIGDVVAGTKTLSTGRQSRAELLFNDNTVARLGANSVFSFKPGSRDIDLKSGFLLLHTPKGKGGAKISTPSASASVLGTTIMLAALPGGGMKLAVLEGTASVKYNGVTQTIHAGQLVFMTPENGMSPPITVSLQQLMGSSALVNGFSGKIGSEQLIQDAIADQADLIAEGELEVSGVNIAGDGTLGIVNQATLLALLQRLEIVSAALAQLTAEIEEDLTGSFTIAPPTSGDFGVPELVDPTNAVLFGTLGEDGNLTFKGDRFHFTLGPPLQIDNSEGITGLTFLASGQSVNYITSFNAIRFDGFNGTIGGNDPLNLTLRSQKGSIGLFNSELDQLGQIFFHASGQGLKAGNVELSNSVLHTTGNKISLSSAGASLLINNHSQILLESGPGAQVQLSAPSLISINDSLINTALGTGRGSVLIQSGQNFGRVDLVRSEIIAPGAPVDVIANTINLTDVLIKAHNVELGNSANTAAVNFIGNNNYIYTASGVDGVIIHGVQSGVVNVGTLGQEGTVPVAPPPAP